MKNMKKTLITLSLVLSVAVLAPLAVSAQALDSGTSNTSNTNNGPVLFVNPDGTPFNGTDAGCNPNCVQPLQTNNTSNTTGVNPTAGASMPSGGNTNVGGGTIPSPANTAAGSLSSGVSNTGQKFTGLTNPLQANSVQEVLLTVVDLAMNIGIILAVIMVIYAGFRFIWARGNAEELKEARTLFFYVIIGLAILISSKVIVNIVENTLVQANVVNPAVFNKTTTN